MRPALIVILRAAAVVMPVVPNSPISAAAGAAYGEVWGLVYVMAGAETGAVVAFLIGRRRGSDAVRRWRWLDRVRRSRLGRWRLDPNQSQNQLMGVVFLVRALPFLNMDIGSYVAGVTHVAFWRYALANLLGMLSFSFLVVFLGDRLARSGSNHTLILMALVGIALLPVLARVAWTG